MSFDEFFRDVFPAARTLAFRILGELTEAEDVAAEAFARALVRWPAIQASGHREAWVMRVCANLAIDAARRRSRSGPVLARLGATGPIPAEDELVVLRDALVAALLALPRRQREAIVLIHLVGLSPGEAARAMRVSGSSVSEHVRRGFDRLRKQLNDPVEAMTMMREKVDDAHSR